MATQTPRVPGIGKASKTEAIRALKYTTFQELALALDTAKTEDLEATVVDFHQWIQWTDCTTPLQEEVQTTVLFDLMRDDPLSKRLGRLWDQLVQRGPASTLASELPFICAAVLQRVYRTEFHQHGLRLAQTILDNYLDLLYRLLNSDPDSFDQPGAAKAVLELLRTMATYHLSLAQTLVRSFDFSFKKWQALMERRESNPRYAPHLPIQANVPIQKTVLLDRYVVENMDTRTVFVRFVMAFFIHGDATTKEFILGKHPLMSALVDGLSADAYETILHALLVLHDHVLADPTVTSDLRVSFLKGRCMNSLTQHLRIQPIKLAVEPELLPYLWATEGVSPHLAAPRVELDPRHPLMGSLINNAEGSFLMDNSVDLVERFLLRVFTVPQFALGTSDPGWYPLTNRSGAENIAGSESKGVAQGPPGSEWDESSDSPTLAFRPTNLALYHFIHNAVRPTTGVRRRDFFLTLVRACPDQLYFYTQSAQLVLEPHLNVVYLSTVALLLKLIQLPNPHAPASSHSQKSWAPTGISTKPPPEVVLIANVMPTFLNREILNRGLLHPSSLVVYNTQLLLAAVLQKLGRVLTWIDNQVDRMQSSTLTSAEGITEWLRVRKQLVNHVRTHLPDFDKVTYIQSQFLPDAPPTCSPLGILNAGRGVGCGASTGLTGGRG
ncbi:ribosome 60S biogenesis N-terminal-domain-containing protein [Dimargaris cristalligena]|uniref:Ribosome 60S biogenesis N-terminal-domain-containing protein n=1 Tax=Dimargaris cristalligena TaxID=215637 RepID=A0A4P9ZTE5_9FUNG|nr:ribosome 60S biogenesis N-terminal-domain-containing protein [Dimargaris cristalligena]|eukprot:RKP36747.1 ribosome 60S biogenesis N-terminal-domain-containing protein [Dimargaris cristalligena]